MEILLIGNGFDLAHGLPTRYKDFLGFCVAMQGIYSFRDGASVGEYETECLANYHFTHKTKTMLKSAFSCRSISDARFIYDDCKYVTNDPALDEMSNLLYDNLWYEYFLGKRELGDGWVDFETEIARIIQALDGAIRQFRSGKDYNSLNTTIQEVLVEFSEITCRSISDLYNNEITLIGTIKTLELDLKRLVRAFEVYLTECIPPLTAESRIKDMAEISKSIDHVLSFNYTDIYEKLYGDMFVGDGKVEYCYIHGKADYSNSMETNNMVLGINEYLRGSEKNNDTTFIAFKKYFQRILKSTQSDYLTWAQNNTFKFRDTAKTFARAYDLSLSDPELIRVVPKESKLYIFGHSLDKTDGDVLRNLILNDNIQTFIYYYRETEEDHHYLANLITNLVRVIGSDELISRTGGKNRTISFIPQTLSI